MMMVLRVHTHTLVSFLNAELWDEILINSYHFRNLKYTTTKEISTTPQEEKEDNFLY